MEGKSRLLAAIMFTDIVGYTAMMQESEDKAATVRQRHREVFEREHAQHHGRILQYYGDGTLSIFQSAVEATRCAIKMQQVFQSGTPVPLRIGLHLGDIVINGDDIYGDGVNLASRIESLGVPGCILISDKLRYAIKSHDSILTESLGYFDFKNIKEAVEVFAVSNRDIKVPARKELQGKLSVSKKTIAVLPFVNMSSDPDNEYFSDGISEEILNVLVKVEGLQVTARTSSFAFKGQHLDVREIGRLLNVAHILEGSVRKAGNRVRITAQLVSGMDGYHFFSETYDRTLDDIFAVQDEIAQAILNRLREHLGEEQHASPLVKAPTDNMEAYDQYLRGLYLSHQYNDVSYLKAIPYFNSAIQLAPDFALPYAQLLTASISLAFMGKLNWKEAGEKNAYYAEKLEKLEEKSPEVMLNWAIFLYFFKWDWNALLTATEDMYRHYQNTPQFYWMLSMVLSAVNDPRSAEVFKKALPLDPLSPRYNYQMANMAFWAKQLDTAKNYLDNILEKVPHHRTAREYLGWYYFSLQEWDKALGAFEKMEPERGVRLHKKTCLACAYIGMGNKKSGNEYLKALWEEAQGDIPSYAIDLATVHAIMGDKDKAFLYLETAIDHKVGDIMSLERFDLFFGTLKADSRFDMLRNKIGWMQPENLQRIHKLTHWVLSEKT